MGEACLLSSMECKFSLGIDIHLGFLVSSMIRIIMVGFGDRGKGEGGGVREYCVVSVIIRSFSSGIFVFCFCFYEGEGVLWLLSLFVHLFVQSAATK